MQSRKLGPPAETPARVRQQDVAHQTETPDLQETLPPPHPPGAQMTFPIGNAASARAHAAVLNRATGGRTSHAGDVLLQLQRQYGNRYVQRVLQLARQSHSEPQAAASDQPFSHPTLNENTPVRQNQPVVQRHADASPPDESFAAFHARITAAREANRQRLTHLIQPTLTVTPAGDKYEQEADRVANQVVNTIASSSQQPVQRQDLEYRPRLLQGREKLAKWLRRWQWANQHPYKPL